MCISLIIFLKNWISINIFLVITTTKTYLTFTILKNSYYGLRCLFWTMILFHHQTFNIFNFILVILFSVYISFNLPYQACFEFWEELNDQLVNWGWKLKLKEQGPYLTKKTLVYLILSTYESFQSFSPTNNSRAFTQNKFQSYSVPVDISSNYNTG